MFEAKIGPMTDMHAHRPEATLDYRGPQGPTKPGGLIAWGVVLCVLGAGTGCLAVLTPLMLLVPSTQRMPAGNLLAAGAIYLGLSAAAFVLAVACFRARRWVSKVMLALAWPTLVSCALMVPVAAASAAMMEMPAGTPAGLEIATTLGVLVGGLLMGVAMPLTAVWYFGSNETRRRLAELDPAPNWADGKPTPILGLALWMGLGGLMGLAGAAGAIAPFFGVVLTGAAAVGLLAGEAAALLLGSWLTFHKRVAGWWIALCMTLVFFGSSILTTLAQGAEAVTFGSLTAEQQAMMRGNPMLAAPVQASLSLLYMAILIGVLLWIRPYFSRDRNGG